MRKQTEAKGILLDLLLPVLILLVIAGVLLVQQRGYISSGAQGYEETFIDQDAWELICAERGEPKWSNGRLALIVYTPQDDESITAREQFRFVLSSIGVQTADYPAALMDPDTGIEPLDLTQVLPEGCTDIIICTSALMSAGISPGPLETWVAAGGHLMLACGLET